ncbi:PDZ domain-containing protein [Sphingobacterium bovistauri]|uniref:PDZ domain-containing protein n=1 Tax=Sphingobacterium bovistauri TaxID=2781959 RepID=A0ABS7Z4V0_9SPHI|nr:PDZ domain-containing protein [Sphingobacterium bovistauri]MCA5003779.1 PDZ domain-containing protein [Sphingobacterium bovistauri]
MRALFILIFIISLCEQHSYGQFWQISDEKRNKAIPFEFVNNLIIIEVILNDEPLSFILDNGVKETLLFGEIDSLRLRNTSSFVFQGFGIGKPINGLISKNNKLQISNVVDTSHHLYVITDTSFNLSKNVGVHIHGILGSSFFRNNVIAIDYVKNKIIIARRVGDLGIRLSKFKEYPIEIENDRAYKSVHFRTKDSVYNNQKVLLDLGNSDPMMLFQDEIDEFNVYTPYIRDYLGYGFSGEVFGLKNRIQSVVLGDYTIKSPIVSYPDTNSYDRNRIAKNRVGSIGNQVLSRFYLVFDYTNDRLYLKPNKNFNKPFTLDMSGLEIVHGGFEFVKHRKTDFTKNEINGAKTINFSTEVNYIIELHSNYVIDQVRRHSPAERIGVKIGDKLLKINGSNVGKMKLQQIKSRLQAGQDKRIKIQVLRENRILNFDFKLEDPLSSEL